MRIEKVEKQVFVPQLSRELANAAGKPLEEMPRIAFSPDERWLEVEGDVLTKAQIEKVVKDHKPGKKDDAKERLIELAEKDDLSQEEVKEAVSLLLKYVRGQLIQDVSYAEQESM